MGDIVFYNDTIAIFKEWGDETLFRTYVTKDLRCDSMIGMNAPLFGKSVRKEIRFAKEKEKEQLFQAIKDHGYKWNTETKTLEKLKKEKFDPKTLQPFDKVLVSSNDEWFCDFFSHYDYAVNKFNCTCTGGCPYDYCIPYNGDTKHLIGKSIEETPEFYRYWGGDNICNIF